MGMQTPVDWQKCQQFSFLPSLSCPCAPFTSSRMAERVFWCLTGHHQGVNCCEQYCEGIEVPDCRQSLKPFKKLSCCVWTSLTLERLLSAQGSRAGRAASRKLTSLPPPQDICGQGFIALCVQSGQGWGMQAVPIFAAHFHRFIQASILQPYRAIHFQWYRGMRCTLRDRRCRHKFLQCSSLYLCFL